MAEQVTPEEVLKQQIWKWAGWTSTAITLLVSGLVIGWLMWGDACGRCEAVQDLTAKVAAARAETETVKAQEGQKYRALEREKEGLQRQLEQAAGGKPAA